MLSASSEPQIIKQGFVFKKGGSGLLAKWRLKFASLVANGDEFQVYIYDKRSSIVPPKHVITLKRNGLLLGASKSKIKRAGTPDYPFTLVSDSRKFHLSAQSKSEQQEWIQALEQCFAGPLVARPKTAVSLRREDDTVSTYTQESCAISVYSASPGETEGEGSTFETLSFCSEPVLTPSELSNMGSKEVQTRRKGPISSTVLETVKPGNWNNLYQRLICAPLETDEQLLKQDLQVIDLCGMFQETVQQQVKAYIDNLHWKQSKENTWEFSKDGIKYSFIVDYDASTVDQIIQAHKLANHELQGLDFFNSCHSDLGTDLMCIVDYKGFRVVATAEQNTEYMSILYELESEKPSVDQEICIKVAKIGSQLHLKPHSVMLKDDRRVTIPLGSGLKASYDPKQQFTVMSNLESILPMDYDEGYTRIKRLRPEFIQEYPHPLCADAFTEWSATLKKSRSENDEEVIQASNFLKEHWIPSFVRKLDHFEIRPLDSNDLTAAFHKSGVNMRYLGLVAKISKIAFIKEMCCIEMVARAVKSIFRSRIRGAILHFKTVGATQIENELFNYANQMFKLVLTVNEKNARFFQEKLALEIEYKFDFKMDYMEFSSLHRPALLLAMQCQCGLEFEDEMSTDAKILGFQPRAKFVWRNLSKRFEQLSMTGNVQLPREELMAYKLARHFKKLGPAAKLERLESSAKALLQVAAFYNAHGRFEEAKMYATAAANASSQTSCVQGLALAQLLESICGLQSNVHAAPDQTVLSLYKKALGFVEYHWSKANPWTMALHDRMCAIYSKCKRPQQAIEFLDLGLDIATNHLGKHHSITAGYFVKAGVLLRSIGKISEAFQHLSDAMHTYQALQSDLSLVSEAHYHLAEVLLEKGDNDGAVSHAQRCRKLRERCFGQQDPRTIDAYRQVSKMIRHPYVDYKGVITPQIRAAYREIIQNYEKVFRFLKNLRPETGRPQTSHTRTYSHGSTLSRTSTLATSNVLVVVVPHVAGPYFSAPFAPVEPVNRSLMHKLAKQIILLKLDLLEQPNHKEIVRQLRLEISEHKFDVSPEDARDVIFKMAAVSPSVYMDGILNRIDDEDEFAVTELGIVLQLVENEVLGLIN